MPSVWAGPIDSTTYLANGPLYHSLDSLLSETADFSEWFRTFILFIFMQIFIIIIIIIIIRL